VEVLEFVKKTYGASAKPRVSSTRQMAPHSERDIARHLTAAESGAAVAPWRGKRAPSAARIRSRTIGITGPGGAGKTTLIDELALRFLRSNPRARLAILSHDPSLVGQGALLGDRATMIYSQDDRVFMRSLGTRGQAGGLSPATERCLQWLGHAGFDLVLVETVGIGQEAMPFGSELVDKTVLVMSPDYGSRLQLQKIVMLDVADIVVVNKSDLAGAKTAAAEIEQRLALNQRGQKLVLSVAKRHRDAGVDQLFGLLKP